jgi:DNA-binding response OmpR family regulator
MMNQIQTVHSFKSTRVVKTVAVVSTNPHEHVLETVAGAVDYDVVFVESNAHAYSRIKHVRPDLVIVCLTGDDADSCQVLSMLMLDRSTANIPVVTYMAQAQSAELAAMSLN